MQTPCHTLAIDFFSLVHSTVPSSKGGVPGRASITTSFSARWDTLPIGMMVPPSGNGTSQRSGGSVYGVCVCVCVCACMRACVRACVRTCVRACVRVRACVCVCTRACACMHVCMCMCVCVCVCVCVCITIINDF